MSCLAVFVQANAQFDDPKTLEIGPHAGLSYYMGDLNPTLPFAMPQLEYGGVVRYNYNNRWTFRADYSYVTVKADDKIIKWRPERELNFTSKIHDLSFVAEFNFLEYYTGNPKKNVSPYIFGGISVFYYTAYAQVADTLIDLSDHLTEPAPTDPKWYDKAFGKTSPIGISIPFGMGVKFALSKHMAATVEWRMQKTFTDYLDDVATVYPEKNASYEDFHVIKDSNGNIIIDQSYAMIYNLSDPSATPIKTLVDQNNNIAYPIVDENKNIIYPVVVNNTIVYPKLDSNGNQLVDLNGNPLYGDGTDGNPMKVPTYYKSGQQRGNSAFNDWFGMFRVSLTWKFNLPDGRGCNLSKF